MIQQKQFFVEHSPNIIIYQALTGSANNAMALDLNIQTKQVIL